MIGDIRADLRLGLAAGCLAEAVLKQQVVPADDGVLDEAVAGLCEMTMVSTTMLSASAPLMVDPFGFEEPVDIGIGEAGVGPEIDALRTPSHPSAL